MSLKRVYQRKDLVAACALGEYMCAFCRQTHYVEEFEHAADCPFLDPGVVAVEVVTMTMTSPGVVFRFHEGRWWWRGPSGMKYHIERMCGGYVMFDSTGHDHEIAVRQRLSDIRHWIGLNQGKL